MAKCWLSVDEIAAHHGVNPDAIHMWITRKGMPAHSVGRVPKAPAIGTREWLTGGPCG